MNGTSSLAVAHARGLPWRHALLALAVVAVWGTNFVVIRAALDELPPLLFATLRFTLALLPAAFFIKRPAVTWRSLAAYGLLIGFGQFGLLYIAMNGHISPGLASLVVQVQIFFTIALSMWLSGERIRPFQLLALLLATVGIGVIMLHSDRTTTPFGLGLVLIAAMSWAGGNQVAKASGATNMLAFVIWASLFSIPPLLIGSLVLEGPAVIGAALAHAGPGAWLAVLWQSVGNTLFGYAAWGWLLARHPAATITPSAMLVPIFGMGASALLLAEPLPGWKLAAAALVMSGLALNLLWPLASRMPGYLWRRGETV
ncbi:EamA family transporter [Sphingomonas oleivorans]|uniref:EamA family transporter n=1 Tax=Sphingomonas oleivorans TaxID=1735121 RepID=A0A2T5G276_9SPHN|nr:EamA family transporter [Sphingomonas oleivorans]PTQ13221.1 EamA family transporter [Sphingomonas oleivorans]